MKNKDVIIDRFKTTEYYNSLDFNTKFQVIQALEFAMKADSILGRFMNANWAVDNPFEDESEALEKIRKIWNFTKSDEKSEKFERTYTSEETQKILGISKSTLDKMCHNNEIEFYKHPQRRRRIFFESDLIAYQNNYRTPKY